MSGLAWTCVCNAYYAYVCAVNLGKCLYTYIHAWLQCFHVIEVTISLKQLVGLWALSLCAQCAINCAPCIRMP